MLMTQCYKAFLAIVCNNFGIILFKDLKQHCHKLFQKSLIGLDPGPSLEKQFLPKFKLTLAVSQSKMYDSIVVNYARSIFIGLI